MHHHISTLLVATVVAAGVPNSGAAQICSSKDPAEMRAVSEAFTRKGLNLLSARDRTISSGCLLYLLTQDQTRPLRITGAHVEDEFTADYMDVKPPVVLRRTTFAGTVSFENARFRSDVVLDSNTFRRPVRLRGASFEGDLSMAGAVFDSLVDGYQARVGGNLKATEAEFRGLVNFSGLNLQGEAWFEGITARTVDFSRAVFHGDLVMRDSRFTREGANLNLERATIKQSLFLNSLDSLAPPLQLVYAEVGYNLRADSTRWGGYTNMRGIRTGMHLDLSHGTFLERLNLHAAQVGADLRLDADTVLKGAAMNQMHVGVLSMRNARLDSTSTLVRTQVAAGADLVGMRADTLYANGMEVGGRLDLGGAKFPGFLSLAEVDARRLNITSMDSLPPPDAFSVDGLTFGHIESLVGDRPDPDSLIAFLGRAEFSPDAYTALESFFARQGDRRSANRTLFARRDRERDARPWYLNTGSWLLNGTVRYGRWPALAFVWWAAFVVMGTYVFSRARITAADSANSSVQRFDPVWYSLDTFLPMVDLKYADEWKLTRENNRWPWLYLRFHTLMGWVLIPVALAAISGLLK
jgi:uncharacterized protein YjbI with pentapeptide repeats